MGIGAGFVRISAIRDRVKKLLSPHKRCITAPAVTNTCVGAVPSTSTGLAEDVLRAVSGRRAWGCWWIRGCTWPVNVRSEPRNPECPRLHPKQRGQQGEGGDSAPLLLSGETHLECCVQPWGTQHKNDMKFLGWVQGRPWRGMGDWSTSLPSLEKRRIQGDFIAPSSA